MSFVAVAIGGSALIGGATSLIAGNKSANAIEDSAAATDATNRYIYDTTRADYKPYRDVGYGALDKLARLAGVDNGDPTDWEAFVKGNPSVYQAWLADPGGLSAADYGKAYYKNDLDFHRGGHAGVDGQNAPDADPNYAGINLSPYQGSSGNKYADFETSPGYQFRLDEGMKAIERSAAARGGLRSGATMKALNNYAQGVASDEYGKYVAQLQSLAGIGQSATGSTAAAGANYASNTAQSNQAAGQARATAYQNTGNAINSTTQNLASAFLYGKGYGNFGGATSTPSYGFGNA